MSNERRQRTLFPAKKYTRYFIEDKKLVGRLTYLKNIKSNLILNLKQMIRNDRIQALEVIGRYELIIADINITNQNYQEATDALLSAISSYNELHKFDITNKIALRSLLSDKFNKEFKDRMYLIIKGLDFKLDKNPSFDYLKYIIDQFVTHRYKTFYQNINKVPLYIFQNLEYEAILLQTLNDYEVSIHPFYSKEIIEHLELLEKKEAIKFEKNYIIRKENYNLIKGGANLFEMSVKSKKKNLLKKINRLIKDFSQWDTNKIKNWEKATGLLNYFSTGEEIS